MAELPIKKGWRAGSQLLKDTDTYHLTALPGVGRVLGRPSFQKQLSEQGITAGSTPQQFLGAYAARIVADVTNDGTRSLWWRFNHPEAIKNSIAEKAIGKEAAAELGPVKKGLLMAAALAPSSMLTGAYDITNVGQQFRPAGFAQTYAEEGSEDRRETSQPVPELFERFVLSRSGRPLAYEEAKKDIPDLTPERYGNFLRSYYQDKGLLGVLKATPENLQGYPEARLLGYPVTIPSVTAAAGGAAGVGIAARMGGPKGRFGRAAAAGIIGSLGGAAVGNAVNEVIAMANRPRLPTITEYTESVQ